MSTLADLLLPEPPEPGASFRYGSVTETSPLRVRLDGDANAVSATPTTLAQVTVGDRVLVLLYHRRMVIVGVIGGPHWPVHLCEVDLSESGTAGTLQTVNMAISSQTGGFAISSDELLLPATGLWHATMFVDTGTRPTSSTTRHFVQLLLNGTTFNRQGLVMEDYGGTSSDFRATSGDALGVEWYPAVTGSLTGHLIARYIRP